MSAMASAVTIFAASRLLDDEDRALPLPERRRALAESLFGGLDELGEMLGNGKALVCPIHGSARWPTRCPVCAVVECRLRVKMTKRSPA